MEKGHNNPPSQIEFSHETVDALNDWMKEHPVIETEDDARAAKLLIDRGAACSKDMVAERQSQTAPLLAQVETIRATYRQPLSTLDAIVGELQNRLASFIKREEKRRKEIEEARRREAEEAERLAREAEAAEQAAKADAKQGVIDVDVAETTRQADAAFSRFTTATQELRRAERESHVKVGGGFRRAASLRTQEVLSVHDAHKAIISMGLTDAIAATILKEARAFRKAFGYLPDGITSTQERS